MTTPKAGQITKARIQTLHKVQGGGLVEITMAFVPAQEADKAPEAQNPEFERHSVGGGQVVFVRVFG